MQALYSGGTGRTPAPGYNPMGFSGTNPRGGTPGVSVSFGHGMDADSKYGHQVNSANDYATVNVPLRQDTDYTIGFVAKDQPVFVHNSCVGGSSAARMLMLSLPALNRLLHQFAGYESVMSPDQVSALFAYMGLCKSDGATDPSTRTMYGGGARAAVVVQGSYPSCVDFWGPKVIGRDRLWLQLQARIVSKRIGDDDSMDTRIAKRARTDTTGPHPIFGEKGGTPYVAYFFQPVVVEGLGRPTPFDWSSVFKTHLPVQLGGGGDGGGGVFGTPYKSDDFFDSKSDTVYTPDDIGSGWRRTLYTMAVFAGFSGPGLEKEAIAVLEWLEKDEIMAENDDIIGSVCDIIAHAMGQVVTIRPSIKATRDQEYVPRRNSMSFRVRVVQAFTLPNGGSDITAAELCGAISYCEIHGFDAPAFVRRCNFGMNAALATRLMGLGGAVDSRGIPVMSESLPRVLRALEAPFKIDTTEIRGRLVNAIQKGRTEYEREWTDIVISTCAAGDYDTNSVIQSALVNPKKTNKKRSSVLSGTDERADVPYDDFWADVRSGVHRIEHYVGIATMTDSRHHKTVNEPLAVLARVGVIIPANGAACAKYVGDLPKITIAVASHKGGGPSGAYSGSRTVRTDRTSASGGGGVDSDSDNSDYHGLARATQQTATTIEDDDAGGDGQHQDRRSVLQDKPGQTTSYSATHNDAHETFVDETETGDAGQVDLY